MAVGLAPAPSHIAENMGIFRNSLRFCLRSETCAIFSVSAVYADRYDLLRGLSSITAESKRPLFFRKPVV